MASVSDPAMWVKNLLANHKCVEQISRSRFRRFDGNGNGVLELEELIQLANDLCVFLGLEVAPEEKLQTLFDACDKNHDHVLSEVEFLKFFRSFLKSSLPRLEEASSEEADRLLAERVAKGEALEAEIAAKDAEIAAKDAEIAAEVSRRVAEYDGTLVIATFETLQQFIGTRRTSSLVFASLDAARKHGESPGPRGPFNVRCRQVCVTKGRCPNAADTALVVPYLEKLIKKEVGSEMR
eukprot:TRINITY_DN579_c0_g1_i1.p1 TRINITY_DN579_c0_g1~~TRINITY_DN579_c0_g1_i1.p1  ORF type:complete len:264 (+),score=52.84 TRINITY_DN579_c0_g1_i1:80-793(+)